MNNFGLTIQTWYMSINLPPWAPPVWLFGVAWGIIYPLMAVSFGYVFWKSFVKHTWRRYVGALFAVNLLFNLIYSFGTFLAFSGGQTLTDISHLYWPAAFVISVVLITLPIMMFATWEKAKWITFALAPYLLWVTIATMLQFTINFTN